jgi:hypothetical protein
MNRQRRQSNNGDRVLRKISPALHRSNAGAGSPPPPA